MAHCSFCGEEWQSGDGRCHICRQGEICDCGDPAWHAKSLSGCAGIFLALGLLAVAVIGGLVLGYVL